MNLDPWADCAGRTPLKDMADLPEALDRQAARKVQWHLFPPLVRHAMTEAEAKNDPRWLAWNGLGHPDQTEVEVGIRERVRQESAR